jgi:DNA-binding IclR family transcriptional regulator
MINSVLKAIDIMYLFSASEPRLTLAEISQRLGLPKSTAHTLLVTLLSRGFIEKTNSNHYALGTAIIGLTQAVRVNAELRDRAAPLLRECASMCRDSVYLAVRDGDCCLFTYAIESPRRLLARTAVGDRAFLHCTSVGKAIFARLPAKEVKEIVERVGLPAFTEATITDLDALYKELEQTRSRGYALDIEESQKGMYCIGTPIFSERGQVIGSCSISGADPKTVADRLSELAPLVMHTAQEISRRMGYVPAKPSLIAHPPADESRG